MNVASVINFSRPAAPPKRADRDPAIEDKDAPARATTRAEFTAFLNMLVGADAGLRADLLKQLPAEGASLLDHLLTSTNAGDATLTASDTTLESGSFPEANAADAVRYSMLANRSTAAERGIISGMEKVEGISSQNRISPAVLARITSRHTSTVEEMLAAGDREGALARAKLDDLLSKAGTEEGFNLTATNAANAALIAALAASAADVNTPVKDMEALDPELRARFERVVERMKNEFGHDVSVVETARSQARQDHLYAQGRTTAGAIVTWTTDSAHTHGEAVDVVVDGSWNNPTGFARLQQIAKEEGLNTLGAKDPGHLELPRDAWTNDPDVRVTSSATTRGTASASGVARVANVAQVATVATAGNSGRAENSSSSTQETFAPNVSLRTLAQATNSENSASLQNNNAGQSSARDKRDADARAALSISENPSEKASSRAKAADFDKSGTQNASPVWGGSADSSTRFVGPVDEIERPSGASAAAAAERVEGINEMRQQQGAKPLSQMTLEVDGPNGPQQITVDVRGNTVGTHISTDQLSADRLQSRVNELRTGLESRGLESDTVRISTQGARTQDAAEQVKAGTGGERDAIRMNGASASGNSAGNEGQTQQQRDRSSAARDWEDRQAARDEQRTQRDQAGRDNQNPQRRGSSPSDAFRPPYQEKR